jgi:hypothetical protein
MREFTGRGPKVYRESRPAQPKRRIIAQALAFSEFPVTM